MAPNHRFIPGVWLTLSLARFLRVERVGAKVLTPHRAPQLVASRSAAMDERMPDASRIVVLALQRSMAHDRQRK